ncbi:hypothetical protein [Owenweeksia hongkongensis]|uniref:hypothetical protein n=1 Tax=Owenweeksia hongkongensis TaxID=253245 RepID=UPI003A938A28
MSNSESTAGYRNSKQQSAKTSSDTAENSKGILNHRKTANSFSLAAKFHNDAAKFHNDGDHLSAYKCTLIALGHAQLGVESQMQDLKHHALEQQ